jgi:uncharacterized RDD family membrane protein YckC
MYDLQKADLWKRISALLFDFILLVIVVVGAALLLSTVLNYDSFSDELKATEAKYEQKHNVSFDISSDEYDALDEEGQKLLKDAYADFAHDKEAVRLYDLLLNLTLIIVTFAILIGYLLLEFVVPLLLGNGQTLGKKIFGIGVMREDGVKLSPLLLFTRTVLGKFTVETMIPVMIVIMFVFQVLNTVGLIVLIALLGVQVVLICATTARTPIHDKLAHTVTVDIASQHIFDSPEALLAYKQKLHAEQAQAAKY